jgi:hypothetical protein
MENSDSIKLFESKKVRTHWDSKEEQWYFSLIDVVSILTDSSNPRDYWFKRKSGLRWKMELNCRQFVDSSNSKLQMEK